MAENFEVLVGSLISSASSAYQVQDLLGSGTYGDVTQCRNIATNETVAIKILKTIEYSEEAKKEEVILKILKELNSDQFNIVRWNDSFMFKGRFCLEFEKLDISLYDFLLRNDMNCLRLAEIRPIVKQLATALNFMSSTGVVHADLKPENIMMVDHERQPLRVKVIDFGLACNAPAESTGAILQTLWYRSPEVLLGNPFNEAIDVWSLGCIAAEMLLGTPLFPGCDEYDMLRHISYAIERPPDHMLNDGVYAKQFYRRTKYPGLETSQWRFMSPFEARSYAFDQCTISSLSDLKMLLHELSGEGDGADECDQACFLDLLTKMLKVDPRERITPSEILQHPFITMSHLVGKFDDSLHVKLSMELMRLSQCLNPDDGQDTLETCLFEEAFDSPADSANHSVPDEGQTAGLSDAEQSLLQSNTIIRENRQKKRRRDDSECGNRGPETTPREKRRRRDDAAVLETGAQSSPQKLPPRHKRLRDDDDPSLDDNSPAKKRRTVNLNKELVDSVKKLLSNTEEAWSSLTPVAHLKKRKRTDEEASGSSKEQTSPVKRRRRSLDRDEPT